MAAKTKIWVKFKSNTPIPGAVVGEKAETVRAQAGVPTFIDGTYGQQMIDNRFAEKCDKPSKAKDKPTEPAETGKKTAADEAATALAKAKLDVSTSQVKLDALAADAPGRADAEAELTAATAALEALEKGAA